MENFEAYQEMKNILGDLRTSLKLPQTATFTEILKNVKKSFSKKGVKNKTEKRKPKTKINASRVALNKTKIDLSGQVSRLKKTSPNREISPAIYSGPSSARNDKSNRIVFSKVSNGIGVVNTTGRFQPNHTSAKPKRVKKTSNSTS